MAVDNGFSLLDRGSAMTQGEVEVGTSHCGVLLSQLHRTELFESSATGEVLLLARLDTSNPLVTTSLLLMRLQPASPALAPKVTVRDLIAARKLAQLPHQAAALPQAWFHNAFAAPVTALLAEITQAGDVIHLTPLDEWNSQFTDVQVQVPTHLGPLNRVQWTQMVGSEYPILVGWSAQNQSHLPDVQLHLEDMEIKAAVGPLFRSDSDDFEESNIWYTGWLDAEPGDTKVKYFNQRSSDGQLGRGSLSLGGKYFMNYFGIEFSVNSFNNHWAYIRRADDPRGNGEVSVCYTASSRTAAEAGTWQSASCPPQLANPMQALQSTLVWESPFGSRMVELATTLNSSGTQVQHYERLWTLDAAPGEDPYPCPGVGDPPTAGETGDLAVPSGTNIGRYHEVTLARNGTMLLRTEVIQGAASGEAELIVRWVRPAPDSA
ncbi:MAG: hypothetical protein GEEBNDBF_02521 [bacterium]|nr:hypothetical protein [bacterium]